MSELEKKYLGEDGTQQLVKEIEERFSPIRHRHTASEVGADASGSAAAALTLSKEYTNEEIGKIQETLSDKADTDHGHEIEDVNNLQDTLNLMNDTLDKKSQVQLITSESSDFLPTLKIHKLSQEEYDQVVDGRNLDASAIYLTPDEEIDLSPYATIEQLESKANVSHSHDNMYYTEAEIDTKLSDMQTYASTVASTAANTVKNELLNGAGEAYDTLSELGVLIDENTDALDALEKVATGKADVGHTHDDRYYTEVEIDSKLADKSDVSHSHAISDVTDLQTTLNAKATQTSLNSHTSDTAVHITASERTTWNGMLSEANSYTDTAVANKTQVQILIWEADD